MRQIPDPMNPPSVPAQKRAFRADILARRRAMPGRAAASKIIADKIGRLPEFQNAGVVAAFAPMPEEVDITPLLEKALQTGKTLLLPRIVDLGRGELAFHKVKNLAGLVPGKMGIPEPSADFPAASPQTADFFLIPAVAADSENFRLGYGGGFYDRVLAKLPADAKTCCPIFSLQTAKKIPREVHDRQIWCIITEAN